MVTDKFQKERNLINLQHRLQNDLSKATKMVSTNIDTYNGLKKYRSANVKRFPIHSLKSLENRYTYTCMMG
jgi:hypothetical protein